MSIIYCRFLITTEFRGCFTLLLAGQTEIITDFDSIKVKWEQAQRELSYPLSKGINPRVDYNLVTAMAVYILKRLVTGHIRSEISSQRLTYFLLHQFV
ncbi:hypothetical protein ACVBIL_12500 [Shewanella sp. 125m-7]